MLVTLTFVFCFASDPARCVERPASDTLDSLSACIVSAQQQAAGWLSDHPGWVLSRARCRLGPPERQA